MKRYVVGDIHGCYTELATLLEKIKENAGDEPYKVIFVGDYVDRGPDSKEVVETVIRMQREGHVALMGNHEDMLLAGCFDYAAATLSSFGSYMLELPEWASNWMRSLPKYYEDETILVAHAGMKPYVAPENQEDAWLLWYRYQPNHAAFMGKHFYHGHTPFVGRIEQAVDRTNVDSGCVYGGYLAAAIVGEKGTPEGFILVPSVKPDNVFG